MEPFDYSRNFWPRWRDYPDAFNMILGKRSLSLPLKCQLAELRKVFDRNIGVKKSIDPYWPHIVTDKFDGQEVYISPHYENAAKIAKFFHQVPCFRGQLVSSDDGVLVQGWFSSTVSSKIINMLCLIYILIFQLVGIFALVIGVVSKDPITLVIGVIWFLITYIIFKSYLLGLQRPNAHIGHIRKYIEVMAQECEA